MRSLSKKKLILTVLFFATIVIIFKNDNKKVKSRSDDEKSVQFLRKDSKMTEYIDSKGMHVVVGRYVGSSLSSTKPDLTNEELNSNNYDPRPGSGELGQPVFLNNREDRVAKRLWHINKFNILVSDRISVNRTLPEIRKQSCRTVFTNSNYPESSVIIVFHNEAWSTLLRTVHSVINRTPLNLLRQIILVDDNSNRTYLNKDLENYLEENINSVVPCQVIRSPQRVGLIKARLLGAKEAKGDILVFLDAHCETTDGWLEPLVGRVASNPRAVVSPVIDIINDDNFSYVKSFSLHWGGFNWQLHFRWFTMGSSVLEDYKNNSTASYRTPVMAGGLFAIDKNFFYEIGSYDEEMEIWGGENLELSFRVWMCGGSVEIAPCSHVGHVFRKASPYSFPGGVGQVLHTNLARLALVWMDDLKNFYFKVNPEAKQVSINQDVSKRLKLRSNLKCKSFNWYLKNIWPENFLPNSNRKFGKIKNEESGKCLQRPGGSAGTNSNQPTGVATLSTCAEGFFNYQQFVYAQDTPTKNQSGFPIMADESVCLDSPSAGNGDVTDPGVRFQACGIDLHRQKWIIKPGEIQHAKTGLCLTKTKGGTSDELILESCRKTESQKWSFLEEEWS